MKAEIISVGTELLLGNIVNTDAVFLSQRLAELGFDMHHQTVVGDNPDDVKAAVVAAVGRSHVTILSGGLGPTEDDLTRESVAAALGLRLVRDEQTVNRINSYFASCHKHATDNNYRQANVFAGGTVLANDNGTAPGLVVQSGSQLVALLPGPPHELTAMFNDKLAPLLRAMCGEAIISKTLRVFGIGESALETKLGELLHGSNPSAALYAKRGEVHIRVTAKAPSTQHAQIMCAQKAREFYDVLGEHIYGEDDSDMAAATVAALKEADVTVAVAESITGGMIASSLVNVAGASEIFEYGVVTYSDRVKMSKLGVPKDVLSKQGAVCAAVAAQMAIGISENADSDVGVGITGWAGPGGEQPGLVYAAVCYDGELTVRRLELGEHQRDYNRELATMHALDMVRRVVRGAAVENSDTLSIKNAVKYLKNK